MTPLPVCPECRTRLRFEPAARGQQIRCPECHANLLVALDGRVERMTNRAAEDSDGPVTQAKFDSTARRVLVASVIVLFAIGLGWALRARSRSAENSERLRLFQLRRTKTKPLLWHRSTLQNLKFNWLQQSLSRLSKRLNPSVFRT